MFPLGCSFICRSLLRKYGILWGKIKNRIMIKITKKIINKEKYRALINLSLYCIHMIPVDTERIWEY